MRPRPAPKCLSEVADWDWIGLESLPNQRILNGSAGETIQLDYQANTVVNNVLAMTQLCIEGVGVATPPEYLINEHIRSGALVHLFPEWQVEPIPLSIVWPNNVSLNSNAKSLINHLVNKYQVHQTS